LPITTERSEPEPDLAILRGSHADFRHRHPKGSDCRLVIEVADTSLEKDRAKTAIYQDAGVQEYWIVNLPQQQVERFIFSGMSDSESQVVKADRTITLGIGDCELNLSVRQFFD
jgi:Uma2 family endonuclease